MKISVCFTGGCGIYYMMTHTYHKFFNFLDKHQIEYDIYVCLATYTELTVKYIPDEKKMERTTHEIYSILKSEYPEVFKNSEKPDYSKRKVFHPYTIVGYPLNPEDVKNDFVKMFGDKIKYINIAHDQDIRKECFELIKIQDYKQRLEYTPDEKKFIIYNEILKNNVEYDLCVTLRPDTYFNNVEECFIDAINTVANTNSLFFYDFENNKDMRPSIFDFIRCDYFKMSSVDTMCLMTEDMNKNYESETVNFICKICTNSYKLFNHTTFGQHTSVKCCNNVMEEQKSVLCLYMRPDVVAVCKNPECQKVYVIEKTNINLFIKGFKRYNIICCNNSGKPDIKILHPEAKYKRRFSPDTKYIISTDYIEFTDVKRFWDIKKLDNKTLIERIESVC